MTQHFHMRPMEEPDWEAGVHFHFVACWLLDCIDAIASVILEKETDD